MIMDVVLTVGGIIATGVFGLIGWIFKMVFSSIKDVEDNQKVMDKSLSAHKLHSAETFATKVDVDRGFDRVMDKLDTMDTKNDRTMKELTNKIDKKADKSELEYFQKR